MFTQQEAVFLLTLISNQTVKIAQDDALVVVQLTGSIINKIQQDQVVAQNEAMQKKISAAVTVALEPKEVVAADAHKPDAEECKHPGVPAF